MDTGGTLTTSQWKGEPILKWTWYSSAMFTWEVSCNGEVESVLFVFNLSNPAEMHPSDDVHCLLPVRDLHMMRCRQTPWVCQGCACHNVCSARHAASQDGNYPNQPITGGQSPGTDLISRELVVWKWVPKVWNLASHVNEEFAPGADILWCAGCRAWRSIPGWHITSFKKCYVKGH